MECKIKCSEADATNRGTHGEKGAGCVRYDVEKATVLVAAAVDVALASKSNAANQLTKWAGGKLSPHSPVAQSIFVLKVAVVQQCFVNIIQLVPALRDNLNQMKMVGQKQTGS